MDHTYGRQESGEDIDFDDMDCYMNESDYQSSEGEEVDATETASSKKSNDSSDESWLGSTRDEREDQVSSPSQPVQCNEGRQLPENNGFSVNGNHQTTSDDGTAINESFDKSDRQYPAPEAVSSQTLSQEDVKPRVVINMNTADNTVTSPEPETVNCKYPNCTAKFSNRKLMLQHYRRHHRRGEDEAKSLIPSKRIRLEKGLGDEPVADPSKPSPSKSKTSSQSQEQKESKVYSSKDEDILKLVKKGEDYYKAKFRQLCPICKEYFEEPKKYRLHEPCFEPKRSRDSQGRKQYFCPHPGCDKPLTKLDRVRDHLCRVHFPETDLLFRCLFLECSQAFLLEKQVVKHYAFQHLKCQQ